MSRPFALVPIVALTLATFPAHVQGGDLSSVEIKTSKVAEGVYVLFGAGGNIGVSVGDDGIFLVDDQFAELTPKIKAALAALTKKPVRFVLNTHWHGDHVGGNENLAVAGAVVVAHDNVRKRMSVKQFVKLMNMEVPPSAPRALPIVTFTGDITFHLNGEEIRVFPVAPAHTDGDAIIWFRTANVVHMGDCFMTVSYPFVDVSSGGRYDGFIAAADRVLGMIDDKTRVIPGHGPVTDKAALKAWRDMLATIRERVKKQVAAGKTLAEIQAAKLTTEWDAQWGTKFIQPEQVVEFAYEAVRAR